DEGTILEHSEALIVTHGERGSVVRTRTHAADVPAVPPRRILDPTGVGDAYRGGLLKGMSLGLPYETCAQLGSVAAVYALEHLGGQSHSYSFGEFMARYEEHFAPLKVPVL